ncbi:MAG: hypothetical protein AAGC93_21410 [Cyanobacteria bacterium P01_F01_bin.53]
MRYSGTQLSALAQVDPYEINQPCSGGDQQLSITLSVVAASPTPSNRKHRPKGSASGWLELRTGNRKRKRPSVSHYYRWDSPKGRVSEYVKASRVSQVHRLIAEETPALDILKVVVEGKKTLSGVSAKLLGKCPKIYQEKEQLDLMD